MTPLLPKTKAGQLVDLLRARIASGEWSAQLPAERHLAEEFVVSRSTLRAALRVLENEQWIAPGGSTRSGRVVARGAGGRGPETRSGRVRILTPSLVDSPLLLEHIAILRGILGKAGVGVEVREAASLTSLKRPESALRKLALAHPGEIFVLHKMPRAVHLAMEELRVPAMVYGSTLPGVSLPAVDIDFAATARHAVGRCLAARRTRIGVIVHRTSLAGDEILLEEIMRSSHQAELPVPLVLRHDFHRQRLMDSLDRMLAARQGRPDVLIVVNQHHLLTALPHCLRRGVRIPEDLALLYLGNDPVSERLSPLPDRYDTGTALPRSLAKACLELLGGERSPHQRILPRALQGETMPAGRLPHLRGGA